MDYLVVKSHLLMLSPKIHVSARQIESNKFKKNKAIAIKGQGRELCQSGISQKLLYYKSFYFEVEMLRYQL